MQDHRRFRRQPGGLDPGIIQLQWIETNWGYYQGEKDNRGRLARATGPTARQASPGLSPRSLASGGILFDNTRAMIAP